MLPHVERHDNGFYYVHWTNGRRSNRQSLRTRSPEAARVALADWIQTNGAPVALPNTRTVAALWKLYDEQHIVRNVVSPGTLYAAWKHLKPVFGGKLPQAIDQTLVDVYVKGRDAHHATIRRELGALRACLNWCASPKRRLLTKDVLPSFDLPDESAPRERWLTSAELKRLLAHIEGDRDLELFVKIALNTGARLQAIMELTWDRVDFEAGVILFDVPGRKQTKKRRADVPISDGLRMTLYKHRRQIGKLFTRDLRHRLGKAAAAAGVEGVTPHVLRHTAATHMAKKGVPLFLVAKVLGNTMATVEKTYAKYAMEDLKKAVETIG